MIRRALISVYDKEGLDVFAEGLHELGVAIVASGGTATFIEGLGIPVTKVDDLTEYPSMFGGRVKTLHPRIHGAILARRDVPDDVAALEEHGIEPFDLVCVNLYPFRKIVAQAKVSEAEAIEMIDIGGPAMLRAAAKNFAHVAPLCRADQYGFVLDELRASGELSRDTRRDLAAEAFAHTALYESAIAAWFADLEIFPETYIPGFVKVVDLAYGENPHQRAAYYAEAGARRHLLSRVTQLSGKELSFNNLNDLNGARLCCEEFELPACVIVKHANPCGVAVATSIEEAYTKALAADPLSAYGGVVVLNRPVHAELAESLAKQFIEVLFAPGVDDDALAILRRKEAMRILADGERRRPDIGERDVKRVIGGVLVQDRDSDLDDRESSDVAVGTVDERLWGDLLFSWRVCRHVSSNAIVIAKDLQTIGIGAGQMSRVEAVKIAVAKAQEQGHDLAGAVLASDAFFPFADGPEIALEAGVAAIIQPGGSKRDDDVIAAVERAGATMVFTHRRHFRH